MKPPFLLGRRHLVLGTAAGLVTSCGSPNRTRVPQDKMGQKPIDVWSWFDLPKADPRSRELSGIAWDGKAGVLWAVQDEEPQIVALRPDGEIRSWAFAETVSIEAQGPLDLEGVALADDGFVVCSEEGPRIVEVDRRGHFRRDVPVPGHFRAAKANKSLESLSRSPSGRFLFTTTEVALPGDGPGATPQAGTRVRIARLDLSRTGGDPEVSEHVYETDRTPAEGFDWGVSDLAAIADDELLVLERGWAKPWGNVVRVYHVRLEERARCTGVDALTTAIPPLTKTLYVDVGRLAGSGLPAPRQPQPNPLLDNYEGLSLGPRLVDGRSSLVLASDDNGHADQVARILVLAIPRG